MRECVELATLATFPNHRVTPLRVRRRGMRFQFQCLQVAPKGDHLSEPVLRISSQFFSTFRPGICRTSGFGLASISFALSLQKSAKLRGLLSWLCGDKKKKKQLGELGQLPDWTRPRPRPAGNALFGIIHIRRPQTVWIF